MGSSNSSGSPNKFWRLVFTLEWTAKTTSESFGKAPLNYAMVALFWLDLKDHTAINQKDNLIITGRGRPEDSKNP